MPNTTANDLIQQNVHSIQRKAAIAWGRGTDHAGHVNISPIQSFDLDKTIFTTLEGKLPRMVIEAKIAKKVTWSEERKEEVEADYLEIKNYHHIPDVNTDIIDFMLKECDFSMEHADGSFLEHLIFCHDYSAIHYPSQSPTIQLLHSILGTATNTFAMKVEKLPSLNNLLTEQEQLHIAAFPSILRLISNIDLLEQLTANIHRLHELQSIRYYRVIDNKQCEMSADDLWVQLNHQLVHFIDFLPAANWANNASDPVLQSFVRISQFLDAANKRVATVGFSMPESKGPFSKPIQEKLSIGGRISSFIPSSLKRKLAAKSVRKFSESIGHNIDYTLRWQ